MQRVIYQSAHAQKSLDGVAIVSAIVAAKDPKAASRHLLGLVKSPPPFAAAALSNTSKSTDVDSLLKAVPAVIKKLGETTPLCHNMTNLVVQNFSANVALSIGASPIMANYGEEAQDLANLGGSLVVNMGTVTPEGLSNYLLALKAYNGQGGPIVFDPVGAGATAVRRNAVKSLLAGGYFDLIKGNEGEIKTVYGETGVQQRGVDSGPSTSSDDDKAKLVRELAARERNIVVMTGVTDLVSDGERTFAVSNGHELLGRITGSGCVLGTTMASMMAVCREDKLLAAIAGLLHYEIAAEMAAARDDVKGPGTFVAALIDELYNIQKATARGDLSWLGRAKVKAIEIS